ncbi:hypothetical protein CTAYLR_002357 [Chrysophaeum taylorii]|uniref:protein-tyrosine-phosphatase n=1 Tax=Chrysophaeum taylorii TaxID=2483200 RepID=A0AAD7UGY3_9STRA|nr:hypothetical protein CTAYLR_002357 [Chrysophaeum taylorii]
MGPPPPPTDVAVASSSVLLVVPFFHHLSLAVWMVFVLGFALFQRRLLPARLAKLAAKCYFYPTLPLTYARLVFLPPRAGLWTPVDDTVIVGAAPLGCLGHPSRLRRLGVRAVVNCCDEYEGPNWARSLVDHLHVPTVDHVEPSRADLETAVRFIDAHRKRGHKVYVHCKAGHGRSAAVAYAWLLHANHKRVAPFDLFEALANKRKVKRDLWQQPNILAFYDALPLATPPLLSFLGKAPAPAPATVPLWDSPPPR